LGKNTVIKYRSYVMRAQQEMFVLLVLCRFILLCKTIYNIIP